MRTATAVLSLAFALGGCGAHRSASSVAFRKHFAATFLRTCTTGAKGHLGAAVVKRFCGCSEAHIERRYSDAQIVAIAAGTEPKSVNAGIASIQRACAHVAFTAATPAR